MSSKRMTTHLSKNENSINTNSSGSTSITMPNYNVLVECQEIEYTDLDIYERCGKGSYGSVYRGLWKSRNIIVAIKKLLYLENEAKILCSCSHRNIIKFYGVVSQASNYCIVTEYAEYGSLQSFISLHDIYKEYGLDLILTWAIDIALGMNYLHCEAPFKIIHRDLKSNNVLITGENLTCKICDFGSSRFGNQTTKMTIAGTFPWMSPEIIQAKPANQSCDVWSFGVVLWELITGEIPFKGIEEIQIAFLVVEKDQRLPIPNTCPRVLANIMEACWQKDPKDRLSFKQILAKLDKIDEEDKIEIDDVLKRNKSKWDTEIQQAFERLRKVEDDLHLKEKLLEAREKRLREMEIELISCGSKLAYFEEHDVNSWGETDVVEWIKKISHKHNTDLIDHSEKFLNHNINGKRLLLLTKEDLRNIGISSEGHIVDLYHEIHKLKLENDRLLNFPPLKQRTQSKTQVSIRSASYNLLIGSYDIKDPISESLKWKVFIDFDECDDCRDLSITSLIRDVKFISKNQFELVSRPPFVMRNWIKGDLKDKLAVNCIITYEDSVVQPRKNTIDYELNFEKPKFLMQTIRLSIEEPDSKTFDSSISSSNNTATAYSIVSANIIIPKSNSPLSALVHSSNENVWLKRCRENSILNNNEEHSTITETKVSIDKWSGIVSGKYKSDLSMKTKTDNNENQTGNSQTTKATGTLRSFSSPNNLHLQSNKTKSTVLNQSLLVKKSAFPNCVDRNVQPIITKTKSNTIINSTEKNSQKKKNPFFY